MPGLPHPSEIGRMEAYFSSLLDMRGRWRPHDNAKTARNQILGAVVMGIGMGMLEETIYDPRTGHPINNNFADYMVAVSADVPELDCIFLDYPDPVLNEYDARGMGEIGLTGCASALTMATYHATGVRIRELPIRIEKLMAGSLK